MEKISLINKALKAGEYDAKLASLYCRSGDELLTYRERISNVLNGFMQVFDCDGTVEVSVCSAPGRTELGGNHTDHQGGKVLTASVDLDALAGVAKNGTNTINIFSEGYGKTSVCLDSLEPVVAEKDSTAAIIRGTAAKISSLGYHVEGFDAYITSNVPGGSGLSSSACLEVLIGVIINHLFCNNEISNVELAKIGQYAENVYFGKPSGLLDQMGCAMGGIVAIDFKDADPVCRQINFNLADVGYAMCIIDTGANHMGLTEYYAAVPAEMKAVAKYFGKEVLSQLDESEFFASLPSVRAALGDRAVLRAVHYFSDCKRVDAQVDALGEGNFDEYLRLVNDSGRSSFMWLQNISTYRSSGDQPIAVALAVAEQLLHGRGAVRVHGGGFAGTIQAYVPKDMLAEFCAGMNSVMGENACKVTYIRPIGGAVIVE